MFETTKIVQAEIPELTLDHPLWTMSLGQMTRHRTHYWDKSVDFQRNAGYEEFLEEYAKDKVVCDLGSGTGILLHLAEYYGASKCIGIENSYWPAVYTKGLYPHWDIHYNSIFDMDEWPEADIYVHGLISDNIYHDKVKEMFDKAEKLGVKDKVYPNHLRLLSCTELSYDEVEDIDNAYGDGMQSYYDKHKITYEELDRVEYVPNIRIAAHTVLDEEYNGHIHDGWGLGKLRDASARPEYLGWEVSFDGDYFYTNYRGKTSFGIGQNWKW